MWIDDPALKYTGLFGYARDATFDQLGVETGPKGITGGNYVGAICGYFIPHSLQSISQCYSKGSITGKSSGECYAGGITGYINNINRMRPLFNCYSEASVHVEASQAYVGGINGSTDYWIAEYCYATGKLSAQVGYGQAVIGGISPGSGNEYSYYDSETTGVSGGKTTAEMKLLSTYAGWDFNTIWFMEGVSYPKLQCFGK